jgi:hypothetical protein
MRKTVIVVGAGILGCVVASELLEFGFSVVLVTEAADRKKRIKSSGVLVDSELIPTGLGGGGNIWSGLSGLVSEEEWAKHCQNGFTPNSTYRQLKINYKKAAAYGFPSMGAVEELDRLDGYKLFFKPIPKRLYNFKELLTKRSGLKIVIGNFIDLKNQCDGVVVRVDTDNSVVEINANTIVFAAGGLGNLSLISPLFGSNRSNLLLHVKGYVGKVKFSGLGVNYSKKLFHNTEGSMIYYYGYVKGDPENYLQVFPCKYYQTDSFVEFFQTVSIIRSTGFFSKTSIRKVLKILTDWSAAKHCSRVLIGSIFPSLLWLFHKITRLNVDADYAKIMLHLSPDPAQVTFEDNIFVIDQKLTSLDLLRGERLLRRFINELEEKTIILSSNLYLNNAKFQNGNHYSGTVCQFLEKTDLGYLSGRVSGFNNIYSVGTSNIWFKTNVNPTFLSLAMAFFTIDEIVSRSTKKD